MAFGVTPTGFVKKTIDDITVEITADLQESDSFGSDFDLRQSTAQYQFISSFARQFAMLWDQAENLYNSRFVNLSENNELDYNVKFIGLRRSQSVKATGEATFTGENATIVPLGFIIQDSNGIQFETTESGTVVSGTVTLDIRALISGTSGNVPASTITEIFNPLSGITAVTNALSTENGVNKETDEELRERYTDSLSIGGGSTTNAVRAALLQVTSVTDVIVRNNETDTTVGVIPPHSIAPVVLGGANDDIFQSIFDNKAGGIQSFGTLTKTFNDDNNNNITIGFSRPTLVDVWIRVTVTSNSNYPTDGNDQVNAVITNFINNLEIDENVQIFDLTIEVGRSVEGIENLAFTTSTDGTNFTASDIMITNLSKAQTTSDKVVVS